MFKILIFAIIQARIREIKIKIRIKMNIKKYSAENREKIYRILKIFVDNLELTNRQVYSKVPINVFEREGFSYDEVVTVLKKIGWDNKLIVEILTSSHIRLNMFARINNEPEITWSSRVGSFLTIHGLSSEKDIYKYVFYKLKDFDKFILLAKKTLRQIEKYNKNYKIVSGEIISASLPPKTKWQDIILKFKDKYNVVPIIGDRKYESISFAQMGFLDMRSPEKLRAKDSWAKLLKYLATNDGSYDVTSDRGTSKDDFKKQKQEIRSNFREVFGIEEDPFYKFDGITYKIKVKLVWFE